MWPLFSLLLLSLAVLSAIAQDELSPCLKKCLQPITKMERTYYAVFAKYEQVCDILDGSAYCAQKCGTEDNKKFYQFTTFYRVHCINHEEELEPNLECLKTVAKDVDPICKDKCRHLNKVEPNMTKEEKINRACKALECSTVCYFHEFATDCPQAKSVLLKIAMDQVNESALMIHPKQHEEMSHECRHLHSMDYMRAALLASLEEE